MIENPFLNGFQFNNKINLLPSIFHFNNFYLIIKLYFLLARIQHNEHFQKIFREKFINPVLLSKVKGLDFASLY